MPNGKSTTRPTTIPIPKTTTRNSRPYQFSPETEGKTPLANITAVYTIANKQNDYATGKTLKQFITEAKRMKDALARKPTQNPTSPPKKWPCTKRK